MKRVVLIANPRSGRGRALRLRDATRDRLAGAGHEPRVVALEEANAELMREADAAVVFGGDGTLHGLLPALRESKVAVYHAPLGTENLFAREFGGKPDPIAIARAVGADRVRAVDLGLLNGTGKARPFAIMVSLGPDAGVIHRLHASRRGAITHAAYVLPTLAEVLRPSLPPVTIHVDGREVVSATPGITVVANLRQYGLRIDPAAEADGSDGLLDVVFMPCATGLGALARTLAARLRRHASSVVRGRGSSVRVRSERPGYAQADGEVLAIGHDGFDLRLGVDPAALRVILPG